MVSDYVIDAGKRRGYAGRFAASGLCQTKVPCEARIAPKIRRIIYGENEFCIQKAELFLLTEGRL
jgi:hypothetical protein